MKTNTFEIGLGVSEEKPMSFLLTTLRPELMEALARGHPVLMSEPVTSHEDLWSRLAKETRTAQAYSGPTWHQQPLVYDNQGFGEPVMFNEDGHSSKPPENPANSEENTMDDNYHAALCGVRNLLSFIGEDLGRDGLKDTPARVLKAFAEMTAGYEMNPKDILSKTFEDEYDQMIVVRAIPFVSLCEHHLLPFVGTASVGYLPRRQANDAKPRVVGLSKIARLVECYARRLQIQERLTQQVAEAVFVHLKPNGVGVVVRAEHSCMACRGVSKSGVEMVTSAMYGSFREEPETRAEFLNLCRKE